MNRIWSAGPGVVFLFLLPLDAQWSLSNAEVIRPFSYRCPNQPLSPQYADPHGTILCDGVTRKRGPGGMVVYRGGADVDIDLGTAYDVETVVVHAVHGNENYSLALITLSARILGHWETVRSCPGFWGKPAERMHVIRFDRLSLHVDELRLSFSCKSIVGLTEIEVYGARPKRLRAGEAHGAEIPLARGGVPTAREINTDADPEREVILENRYLRLILDPAQGGVGKSLIYKRERNREPNREFTYSYGGAGSRFGLFRDQLWTPRYTYSDHPYTFHLETRPDRATVVLSTLGRTGFLRFTEIRKRITLHRDRSSLEVETSLKNDPSSMTDMELGLWFHNFAGLPGRPVNLFFPTRTGVVSFRFEPGVEPKKKDVWYRDPSRSWAALVGDDGVGLAVDVENTYLSTFYHWASGGSLVPTFEWRFNRVELKAGETLTTAYSLYPFTGLGRVDGAFGGLVLGLEVPGTLEAERTAEAVLGIHSTVKKRITLAWFVRRLPEGKREQIGRPRTLALDVDGHAEVRQALPAAARGTRVVTCAVSEDGKLLGEVERPVVVGGEKAAYVMAPEGPRKGVSEAKRKARYPRHDISMETVTEHVRWARPYAGGRLGESNLKGLFLLDDRQLREVVELAQRLEIEPFTVKFLSPEGVNYKWTGDRSIQNLKAAQDRLKEYLKQDFDLITVAGLKWDYHFDEPIRRRILDLVKGGAGLIVVAPVGPDEAMRAEAPLFRTGEKKGGSSAWKKAAEHFITRALPFETFPTTEYVRYAEPPGGEVLLTIDKKRHPLLAVATLGKGRVVAFYYYPYTHALSYRGYGGLTPILTRRNAWINQANRGLTHAYWEYYFSLLARAAVWSAGRQTGVEVEQIEVPEAARAGSSGEVAVVLTSAKNLARVETSVTFRDRYSAEIRTVLQKGGLDRGRTRLVFPLPKDLRAGLNFADVIVRDPQGRSLAWGSAAFPVEAGLSLADIAWEKTEIEAGRPAAGRVLLKGTPGALPTGRARLEMQVFDAWDRLLTEREAVTPAGVDAGVPFSFDIEDPVVPGIELRVTLRQDGRILDTARSRALLLIDPPRLRPLYMSWRGNFLWRSEYLFPTVYRLVKDVGVDIALVGNTDEKNNRVWENRWHGMDWTTYMFTKWGVPFQDKGFSKKSAGYAATRDKQHLVREPCLNDPAYREKARGNALEFVRKARRYGWTHDYCMGDEMSLTHYTRYHDFCFGPHCLAGLRKWLGGVYGDLRALNREWETEFKSWADVTPMTADEVRGRGNYSPWADHRTFMEITLADFFRDVRETIQKQVPGAKAGLSGTQAPEAANGMDWWRLSKAFNFFHSYNTGLSEEMRRSFRGATGVMTSPYFTGYWGSGPGLRRRVWYCLLHDTEGISGWTTPLFFYRDLALSEAGRDTRDFLREMKSGLWDLIRGAVRQNDGIALHYSQPSIHAAYILGLREEFSKIRGSWDALLNALGFQYDFVSYAQVEEGVLTKKRYRVLILPESFAISAEEIGRIEEFVRRGGTLVADPYAGTMDDHCRSFEPGLLDRVLGVKRETAPGEKGAPAKVVLGRVLKEMIPEGLKLPVEPIMPVAAAEGSEILARTESGMPLIWRKRFGRGRAVCVNLASLLTFLDEHNCRGPAEKDTWRLFGALFSSVGVEPEVRVERDDGRVPEREVIRYRDGAAEYVACIGVSRRGAPALATDRGVRTRLILGRKAWVYDALPGGHINGKDLGKIDTISTVLNFDLRDDIRLYTLLPRPASHFRVTVPGGGRLGEKLSYRIVTSAPTRDWKRVFHVEVEDPGDRRFRPYMRNLVLPGGRTSVEGAFPLALNDPVGKWKLVVRDVATGKTAEREFVVER